MELTGRLVNNTRQRTGRDGAVCVMFAPICVDRRVDTVVEQGYRGKTQVS